jgi:hypothetical protein
MLASCRDVVEHLSGQPSPTRRRRLPIVRPITKYRGSANRTNAVYSEIREPVESWGRLRQRACRPAGVHPPTPQARDAPHGERQVQSNCWPQQNADEPIKGAGACENRDRSGVIEQHRRQQPTYGTARPVIARQPAGAAQRHQRSTGDAAHDQRGSCIERCPEQEPGNQRR